MPGADTSTPVLADEEAPLYDEQPMTEPPSDSGEIRDTIDPESYYDKLYTALMRDPKVSTSSAVVYAVMRGLCRRGEKRTVFATNETLAETTGLSVNTVSRSVMELKRRGLIRVEYQKTQEGTKRTISFALLSSVYPPRTPDSAHPKMVSPHTPNWGVRTPQNGAQTRENVTREKDPPPVQISDAHGGAGEERMADGSGTVIRPSQPKGPKSEGGSVDPGKRAHPGQERNSGVPKQTDGYDVAYTVSEELALPYWTVADGYHRVCLDKTIEAYPKAVNYLDALIAWREVIGTSFEDDPAIKQRLWDGLVAWKRKWNAEQTEPRYIPAFHNWLRKRAWENAPTTGGRR
jgi:hypothetical protein